jgi:hypothetical protein
MYISAETLEVCAQILGDTPSLEDHLSERIERLERLLGIRKSCNYCKKEFRNENKRMRTCSNECRISAKRHSKRKWWNENRAVSK